MEAFISATRAFERGAQVFINNQEMYGYNTKNQTINTTYSIIPLHNIISVTVVE